MRIKQPLMMMMMIRSLVVFSLFISIPFVAFSQTRSMSSWHGLTLRKDIGIFKFYIEEEVRIQYDPAIMDHLHTEGGVKLEVLPFLQIGQFYRYSTNNELEYYEKEHRIYSQLELSHSLYRTSFEFRSRYQIDKSINTEDLYPEYTLRNRLSVSYDIYRSPLEPYAAFELFNTIDKGKFQASDKYRVSAGIKTDIGDYITLDIGAKYQHRQTNSGTVDNIIGVTRLTINFKQKKKGYSKRKR